MPAYVMTKYDIEMSVELLDQYLSKLIGRFYKILPLRESKENTLNQYLLSLQREMLGCSSLIRALEFDDRYLTLLSVLQYHIDNEADIATVRSDIFKSISILKQLQSKHVKE